ncbi:mediator of RNA polymerase II transcription subunit 34-like [Pistacia vera]|uniref:mediator of RNA polymerase II transcription subunit 34-like n=1 Tax=Pistacia vera TaxID=55513 RepID=UPI001262F4AD|nr:mediator of RNA polymerase II transcription subunit 34-like [Pistacia vera]
MDNEEILQELDSVNVELQLVQDQIKHLLDRQEKLQDRQSELKAVLEACEASVSPTQCGGSVSVEDWSGPFEWDSRADDVRLNVFGISSYRANQREIVNAVMSGRDVLVIMAAGGGKSLCYQLPAILRDGIALVVSPLLSLIQDQVMCLAALGIPAYMLTSTTTKENEKFIYKALEKGEGELKILYVTPEKISKSKRFMSKLEKCHRVGCFSLIAIDSIISSSNGFRTQCFPANSIHSDSGYEGVAALKSLKHHWRNTPPDWVGDDPCGSSWEGIRCDNSSVTSIVLSGIGLRGKLHADIQNLPELGTL